MAAKPHLRTRDDGAKYWEYRPSIGHKQRFFVGPTKRAVLDLAEQAEQDYHRGILSRSKKALGPYMEAWLKSEARRHRPITAAGYRMLYDRYIAPTLAEKKLNELDRETLQAWADDLPTPYLGRQCWYLLRRCLKMAVHDRHMDRNPADAVKVPKVVHKQGDIWEPDEVRKFWAVAQESSYAPFYALALAFPGRPSEILGLRWRNVDLEAGIFYVTEGRSTFADKTYAGKPKNASSIRPVPLDNFYVAFLRRWKAQQAEQRLAMGARWPGEDYVCTGPRGGPMDDRCVYSALRDLAKKAGIKPLSPYEFRNTAISNLFATGRDLKTIANLAGHKDPRTTLSIYLRAHKGTDVDAVNALSSLYHGAESGPVAGSV